MILQKGPDDSAFNEVFVEGEIHAGDMPATGTNPLINLLPAGWEKRSLILDFSKVRFIGSAGISWLITTHRTLTGGAKLVLHSLKPLIDQQISLTATKRIIAVVADRAAAVQLLGGQAHGGVQ